MVRKHWLLLIGLVVMAAIVILSASLHDVHFQPGRSFAATISSNPPVLLSAEEMISQPPLWKVLLFWLAFLINLVLFFFLLPPEHRKRILRQLLSLAVSVLILLMALRYRLIQLPNLSTQPVDNPNQNASGTDLNSAVPVFHPPVMTPWLTFLISVGVLAVLLFLLWAGYRWWQRSQARIFSPLDAIADVARSSLDDLASGREWRDVIIQSYARMSEAVSARRGLQRAEAATPREFAERLERAGLPAEAVKRLTGLFEAVRYGDRMSSQSDVHEAVACLNSILQACGGTP
jgi:hypothetical protein